MPADTSDHPIRSDRSADRPLVIGLIGGIASGKSTVAAFLQQLGAVWIDADKLAREALESDDVRAKVIETFGQEVIKSDGTIDRKRVASLVFAKTDDALSLRRKLESWIHPAVRREIMKVLDNKQANVPAYLIDAPLLIESGLHQLCNRILFVDTPLERRIENARQRGWNPQELALRELAQMPLDSKRKSATDTIVNDGPLEDLQRATLRFWQR